MIPADGSSERNLDAEATTDNPSESIDGYELQWATQVSSIKVLNDSDSFSR